MNLERAFSLIRQLQGALGGKTVRSGTATLTFSVSTDSAAEGVAHGMGKTPTEVIVTSKNAPSFGKIPNCNAFSIGPVGFLINGELKTAHTGDITVSWVAIG